MEMCVLSGAQVLAENMCRLLMKATTSSGKEMCRCKDVLLAVNCAADMMLLALMGRHSRVQTLDLTTQNLERSVFAASCSMSCTHCNGLVCLAGSHVDRRLNTSNRRQT